MDMQKALEETANIPDRPKSEEEQAGDALIQAADIAMRKLCEGKKNASVDRFQYNEKGEYIKVKANLSSNGWDEASGTMKLPPDKAGKHGRKAPNIKYRRESGGRCRTWIEVAFQDDFAFQAIARALCETMDKDNHPRMWDSHLSNYHGLCKSQADLARVVGKKKDDSIMKRFFEAAQEKNFLRKVYEGDYVVPEGKTGTWYKGKVWSINPAFACPDGCVSVVAYRGWKDVIKFSHMFSQRKLDRLEYELKTRYNGYKEVEIKDSAFFGEADTDCETK